MHAVRRGSAVAAAAASACGDGVVRCTRRIRAPLDYLIMQPSDLDQVRTSIRTTDALIVTWYMPLRNAQACLHRRYEAEAVGELLLPRGAPPPAPPRARVLTQDEAGGAASATKGPRDTPTFPMSAPTTAHTLRHSSSNTSDNNGNDNSGNNGSADEVRVPLGLVTMIVGNNYPTSQTLLERFVDPAPHATLSLRIAVIDRVYWQRTSWLAQSVCRSLCWGRLPQRVYGIDLDYHNAVHIGSAPPQEAAATATSSTAMTGTTTTCSEQQQQQQLLQQATTMSPCVFSDSEQRYTTPVCVTVPGVGFRLVVEDTAHTLLDTCVPPVDGFADKESALHRLALAREVVMHGLGGSVYRQTLWCTPCLPNAARVCACAFGTLFTRVFGCNPVGPPVATWLLRSVPQTLVYQMEAEVEDENELNSATTYGDRSITERVQKKAMNRYHAFRDDVRAKAYSELDGRELPR